MASTQPTLDNRIRAIYDRLPTSERALADLLLEFPGDVAIYSATDLAERARVSNAAVSRLVKRLNYADYKEAQREVRAQQAAGQPIYLNNSLVQPPTHGDSLQRHLEQDLMNLRLTIEALNPRDLEDAIRYVLKADTVWTVGFRNSYFFASYLRRQLIQVRRSVIELPVPGQVIMEDLGNATPKDLVIVVGLRRRAEPTGRIMSYLKHRNVPILYITDHRAVTTAKLATWTFPCQVRGVSLFDSYVGVTSLLNYISTEVMAQAGNAGRNRLKTIEKALDDSGEIDPTS
jgi:DNA-binding MurR/RpiR family transcriptional regulator